MKDESNVYELKDFLDQVDVAMPETLIQQQAKECYTYSIARGMGDDSVARQELFKGLIVVFAEKENKTPEECSLR